MGVGVEVQLRVAGWNERGKDGVEALLESVRGDSTAAVCFTCMQHVSTHQH